MNRSFLPAMLVAILAQPSAAGTVIISDGEMDPDNYELVPQGSLAVGLGISQIPLGGNPGTFLQVFHAADSQTSATTVAHTFLFNTEQTYDPKRGSIESLTYREDSLNISRFDAKNAMNSRIALRQDGVLFVAEGSFSPSVSTSSWDSNTQIDLNADDFMAFLNGTFFPTADPDFSISGSPIEFGLYRLATPNGFVYTNHVFGIDNFSVELTTDVIPEPASSVLAALALSVGLLRRRL